MDDSHWEVEYGDLAKIARGSLGSPKLSSDRALDLVDQVEDRGRQLLTVALMKNDRPRVHYLHSLVADALLVIAERAGREGGKPIRRLAENWREVGESVATPPPIRATPVQSGPRTSGLRHVHNPHRRSDDHTAPNDQGGPAALSTIWNKPGRP